MWILGNLLSSNPTILYTIDDKDLERRKPKQNSQNHNIKKGQKTDLISTGTVVKYTILIPIVFYILLRIVW